MSKCKCGEIKRTVIEETECHCKKNQDDCNLAVTVGAATGGMIGAFFGGPVGALFGLGIGSIAGASACNSDTADE